MSASIQTAKAKVGAISAIRTIGAIRIKARTTGAAVTVVLRIVAPREKEAAAVVLRKVALGEKAAPGEKARAGGSCISTGNRPIRIPRRMMRKKTTRKMWNQAPS